MHMCGARVGVLLLARTKAIGSDKSVLYDATLTCLPKVRLCACVCVSCARVRFAFARVRVA